MAGSSKRTYGQYCALAVALDIVGERWTLLIVRELLIRPRRYAELLQAFPGIGTNLLAERLRFLIEHGVIRTVKAGQPRSGYQLTERGQALRDPVLALARWGFDTMAMQARSGHVEPGWAQLGVEALIDDTRASDVDEEYVFHVDDDVFTLSVRNGRASVRPGAADDPAMTISTDAVTLMDIASNKLDPVSALVANRVTVAGDADAVPRCLHLLGLYRNFGDAGNTADARMPRLDVA
jgi:DNA-binding HxlR family transcriptional regulator/putative sterol carrier protein